MFCLCIKWKISAYLPGMVVHDVNIDWNGFEFWTEGGARRLLPCSTSDLTVTMFQENISFLVKNGEHLIDLYFIVNQAFCA